MGAGEERDCLHFRDQTWGTDTKGHDPWTRTQASTPAPTTPACFASSALSFPVFWGRTRQPPGAEHYMKSPGAPVCLCSGPAGKGCPVTFSEARASLPQSLRPYLRIPGVPLVTGNLPSSWQTVLCAEMSHCSLLCREELGPFGSVAGWSTPEHRPLCRPGWLCPPMTKMGRRRKRRLCLLGVSIPRGLRDVIKSC